jgi:hypothetical protein
LTLEYRLEIDLTTISQSHPENHTEFFLERLSLLNGFKKFGRVFGVYTTAEAHCGDGR